MVPPVFDGFVLKEKPKIKQRSNKHIATERSIAFSAL
jgi:hypothetical protein